MNETSVEYQKAQEELRRLESWLQRLQQDHGWLEEDWIELSPLLQAVAEGQNVYDVDTLRDGVNVFVNLYHEHIALEDSMVYPAARKQAESRGQ